MAGEPIIGHAVKRQREKNDMLKRSSLWHGVAGECGLEILERSAVTSRSAVSWPCPCLDRRDGSAGRLSAR